MIIDLLNKETKDEDINGHKKIVVTQDSVHENRRLFDVYYSDDNYAASFLWIGSGIEDGSKIMQPAIATNNPETKYLAYDGQVNHIDGSSQILMPSNGNPYPIEQNQAYFFRGSNPETPVQSYGLQFNNMSIRLNNISIFNENFSKGVMLDFRASMEGVFSDETKSGYIVVLASVDTIN
ncbi:hypothetical protein [uncultured Paraglaciecola sp.]|uniref:hypothetical protein n=1 Tax=uncultured Paraglaciecola sp. TaxID=1765024 RepID=UPI0026130D86|nr:hypothetical protein [uncultured Paraglaciecola sp.]